jgi:phospholipase D1/2
MWTLYNEENLMTRQPVKRYYEQKAWDPDNEQTYGQGSGITHVKRKTPLGNLVAEGMDNVKQGWRETNLCRHLLISHT